MIRSDLFRSVMVVLAGAVVYVALWSDVTFANALWGAVFGAATLVLLPLEREPDRYVRLNLLGLLRYLAYGGVALVRSSLTVVRAVITPGGRLNQAIVEVPLRCESPGLITMIANTISLTPGTLTVDVATGPTRLYVHVMDLRSIDEVRAEVRKLEDMALAAFPAIAATIDPATEVDA